MSSEWVPACFDENGCARVGPVRFLGLTHGDDEPRTRKAVIATKDRDNPWVVLVAASVPSGECELAGYHVCGAYSFSLDNASTIDNHG